MKKQAMMLTVVMAGVMLLASCGNNFGSESVATYKGGKITQEDLYKKMKTKVGTATLGTMVIENVLEKEYGDAVTTKKIDKEFDKWAKGYGGEENLISMVSTNGYTKATFKSDYLKMSLLYQAALKDNLKITDKMLKSEWDNSLNFSIITVAKKADAEKIIKELKAGKDFGTLAASSTDATAANKGEVGWYNTSTGTTYDAKVITAAKKLKDDAYTTTPVDVDGTFYIVKMTVNPSTTSKDMKDYKDKLTEIIQAKYSNDSDYMTKMIGKILKKADAKITDKDMKSALDTYLGTTSSSTSSAAK